MLPRALEMLSQSGKRQGVNSTAGLVEAVMDSAGLYDDDAMDSCDWEALLQELEGSKVDMSFAEVQAKRKQQTFKAFSDRNLPTKVTLLDSMIGPNVKLMDTLFKRNRDITSLYHLPSHEEEKRADLMQRPATAKHL